MNRLIVLIVIVIGMFLSILFAHLWIAMIDGIKDKVLHLFHRKRVQKNNWHTLDDDKS